MCLEFVKFPRMLQSTQNFKISYSFAECPELHEVTKTCKVHKILNFLCFVQRRGWGGLWFETPPLLLQKMSRSNSQNDVEKNSLGAILPLKFYQKDFDH